ncbi:MAG: rhodanese-like domain-containing protein [Longimicrobiales bacterium]|nr:rhodanese-like domain-containing protein [Longimicrobiales bacterium]
MSDPTPEIPEITATALKADLDASRPLVLVDVREHFERGIADLPEVGQLRIPVKEVPERMERIPRDASVVVYCRSGARSGRAVQFLLERGWADVVNLKGGVLAWREEVDPSIAAY